MVVTICLQHNNFFSPPSILRVLACGPLTNTPFASHDGVFFFFSFWGWTPSVWRVLFPPGIPRGLEGGLFRMFPSVFSFLRAGHSSALLFPEQASSLLVKTVCYVVGFAVKRVLVAERCPSFLYPVYFCLQPRRCSYIPRSSFDLPPSSADFYGSKFPMVSMHGEPFEIGCRSIVAACPLPP